MYVQTRFLIVKKKFCYTKIFVGPKKIGPDRFCRPCTCLKFTVNLISSDATFTSPIIKVKAVLKIMVGSWLVIFKIGTLLAIQYHWLPHWKCTAAKLDFSQSVT